MATSPTQGLRTARRNRNTRQELLQKGWYHSMELPGGRVIEGVHSLDALHSRVAQFPIPADLRGKRVLDIGAWDGWFSFEMERRGAQVVAVDCVEVDNFLYARRELGSRVEYREMDIYDLTPDRVGYFDIVLCLGVLYHLKHPLLALERICTLTRELAIIESFVADDITAHTEFPWMEFYETDELGGQLDNWVGPSVDCLPALCRAAGFARVSLLSVRDHSGSVACWRRWEPLVSPVGAAPELTACAHSWNYGVNFYSHRDDYLACWFTSARHGLTRDNIYPEIEGFGAKPVYLGALGNDRFQVNFRLPPGLAPGWHEVRLRVQDTPWSNSLRIAVDLSPQVSELHIKGVADGVTWQPDGTAVGGFLSLWISGLPENADAENVRAYLDAVRLRLVYLSPPLEDGYRQLNLKLSPYVRPGTHGLTVSCGGVESNQVAVRVTETRSS
jgi:tRNA (mo5U34)-methyltransferase